MRKKKYDNLRELYPEYISLDQLCRICRIAKRSARYLVEHEIIPAIDTGKRTWRYRIALDDVIFYLRRREQVGSMIPLGRASSRYKEPKKPRRIFSAQIAGSDESVVAEYFEYIFADCSDVLTTEDVVTLTGFTSRTVLQLLKDGGIKSLRAGKRYIVPKPYFLAFVQSPRFTQAKSNSENFIRVLGGFGIWQTAKS